MVALITIAVSVVAGQTDPLAAERLYHGVGRPVVVSVSAPDGVESIELVLLDTEGAIIAGPRTVRPGRVDVAAALGGVWSVRRCSYLQCLHDGEPAGSALVVQPLLERVVPRTEQVVRRDGSTATRIVGWGDAQEPDGQPGGATSGDGAGGEASGAPPPVFSGFRIYPERDVLLRTSLGDIVLAMRPDEAPNTVWNFRHLVEGGFYDGVIFHRVVPLTRGGDPFVIQAGDPTGEGDGGPGYWLPLEPSGLLHEFGVISMARADHPDSAGSQFFICLSRAGTARLDGQYCAFGYAVLGAETIRAIADVELADVARGRPVDPPVVEEARLVPAPSRRPGAGRPDGPAADPDGPRTTPPQRIPR